MLVVNTAHLANQGSMGRAEGLLNCLEETMPLAQITFLHRYYKKDKDTIVKQLIEKHPNLEIEEHPWFREADSNLLTAMGALARFGFSVSWRVLHNLLRKLGLSLKNGGQRYDVIVDLNLIEPDRLTDRTHLVSTVGVFFDLLDIWYATTTGEPVIVCSATIGPYRSRALKRLAKYVLNKVDIITVREKYSQNYLKLLGINKPRIHLNADLAFLLEPADARRISTLLQSVNITTADKPVVGIAPTAMMYSSLKQQQYIQLMVELSDFLIENLNVTIIYITHTYQDKPITENIYQRVKNKHKARIMPILSASETKGIIGICDIFICSRFHALVASTSLAIPSIGIVAYSRGKFHGIIGEMMGQENYLLDVDDAFEYNAFLGKLKSKIRDLWINKDLIAEQMRGYAAKVKEQALLNGRLVRELLDSLS